MDKTALKEIVCPKETPSKYVVLTKTSDRVLFYSSECRVGTKSPTANEKVSGCPFDKIVFRSPQGMLYFLGQIARVHLDEAADGDRTVPVVTTESGSEGPLFVLKKGTILGDAAISVAYDGETYGIPAGYKERGFSMMAITLVSQVIALQKDPKNIPESNIFNIFSN